MHIVIKRGVQICFLDIGRAKNTDSSWKDYVALPPQGMIGLPTPAQPDDKHFSLTSAHKEQTLSFFFVVY